MLAAEGGRCWICEEFVDRLVIDHDHKDGRIRRAICDPCNRGLGCFKDSTTALLRAFEYLGNNGLS
jgi:hypothetical protein